MDQKNAPAVVVEAVHHISDLLKGGKLLNGNRTITNYRIGWVLVFPGGKTKVKMGDWVAISSGLSPNTDTDIPSQHIPHAMVEDGVTSVQFFVGAVVFADGKIWQENLEEIAKLAVSLGH